jgi:hypothetical protein
MSDLLDDLAAVVFASNQITNDESESARSVVNLLFRNNLSETWCNKYEFRLHFVLVFVSLASWHTQVTSKVGCNAHNRWQIYL